MNKAIRRYIADCLIDELIDSDTAEAGLAILAVLSDSQLPDYSALDKSLCFTWKLANIYISADIKRTAIDWYIATNNYERLETTDHDSGVAFCRHLLSYN